VLASGEDMVGELLRQRGVTRERLAPLVRDPVPIDVEPEALLEAVLDRADGRELLQDLGADPFELREELETMRAVFEPFADAEPTLTEIRDLLRQVLERLDAIEQRLGRDPVEPRG
jgi:hypothetical protein